MIKKTDQQVIQMVIKDLSKTELPREMLLRWRREAGKQIETEWLDKGGAERRANKNKERRSSTDRRLSMATTLKVKKERKPK